MKKTLYNPLLQEKKNFDENASFGSYEEMARTNEISPLSGKPMVRVLVGPVGKKFTALADLSNRLVLPKFE